MQWKWSQEHHTGIANARKANDTVELETCINDDATWYEKAQKWPSKDAQCAETNEKSCFRFLVIGRQRGNHSTTKKSFKSGEIYREDADWSDNEFLEYEFFVRLLVFEI